MFKRLIIYIYKYKIKRLNYLFRKRMEKQDVFIDTMAKGYCKVLFLGKNIIPERCQFLSKGISIGFGTTLGVNNCFAGKIEIGNYCQIGADVAFHASNHPISYLTTYINSNLFNGELNQFKEQYVIKVGHDVWVGHGVKIVGNVIVGNGAIIGAGSVVTKDVAPYSIVAGVPAKEIRKRFSESIIKEIEMLAWWDKSEQELEKIKPLFLKDFTNRHSIYE